MYSIAEPVAHQSSGCIGISNTWGKTLHAGCCSGHPTVIEGAVCGGGHRNEGPTGERAGARVEAVAPEMQAFGAGLFGQAVASFVVF